MPEAICLPVPAGIGDTAAAMAQPLAVALHAVRRSGLRPGQSCAVIGVGGIGAFVVAAAASAGAAPLIALDIDENRLATARQLARNIRRFSPRLAAEQEKRLVEELGQEADPALKDALAAVIGALKPGPDASASLFPTYRPSSP